MATVIESVRERPIIFSPEMAKALDLDQKQMTRRVVRPQPSQKEDDPWPDDDSHVTFSDILEDQPYYMRTGFCPYGKPGDLLWVRENYRVVGWQEDLSRGLVEYQADSRRLWKALPTTNDGKNLQTSGLKAYIKRKLSLLKPERIEGGQYGPYFLIPEGAKQGAWKSSLYMPRWASRTSLNLQSIRIEKLHEISLSDTVLEGVYTASHAREEMGHIEVFRELWDTLHSGGYTWETNPYVFVLGFSKL